jgi:ATP-dependent Clp protease ATP-binding subunit ClpA
MVRLVENTLKKPLAEALLFGELSAGGKAIAEVIDDKVVLRFEKE